MVKIIHILEFGVIPISQVFIVLLVMIIVTDKSPIAQLTPKISHTTVSVIYPSVRVQHAYRC